MSDKTNKVDLKHLQNFSERMDWFHERIGKRIYRNNPTNCLCDKCKKIAKEGLLIEDEGSALYCHMVETASRLDGAPMRYFDTQEEANEFAKELLKTQRVN